MFDIIIVGAGVIGCSVAREVARRNLSTLVLEKNHDVASGASGANSGIVHAGYDAKPGTQKSRFNLLGNPLFDQLSRDLDFPFRRNGSLILAFNRDDLDRLEVLRRQGSDNGLAGMEILSREKVLEMEPNLGPGVTHALHAPAGGIVCPYEMTIAMAENAAENGVVFRFGQEVVGVEKMPGGFILHTPDEEYRTRVLINAAGVYSGDINNRLSAKKIAIQPRRGEYCLLDRSVGGLVRHTLFQVPGKMGKGVLVTPSVDGNILIGPTSEDVDIRDYPPTSADGLAYVLEMAAKDVVQLPVREIITSFAGLRAHSVDDDFIIEASPDVPGLITLAGIESPGLTSAPAIALRAAELADEMTGASLRPDFKPVRRAPPRFRHLSEAARADLIKKDPDYGRIVCRCENVTKAEVIAALRSPLGVRHLDAIKRRTRVGMGRCQAGFCSMRLPAIIAETCGVSLTEVRKSGEGSELLRARNKLLKAGTCHENA